MSDERDYKLLSVLMPVYNEARTLRSAVRAVLAAPIDLDMELICVDDGSDDATWQLLGQLADQDSRIKRFRHERNAGKGTAVSTAIEHMTGQIALIQDADLEYDPADYPALLAPILEDRADAVFGSRFAAASQRRVLLFFHSVANRMITTLANMLNDVNLTDIETCYKAVRADILKQMPLKSKRFGIEPELTTRLVQWGARLYEVPISYHGRTHAEGKKIGFADAVAAVWHLLKFRYLDRRFTTHDGYYILQSMRGAHRFNRWMFSRFQQYVGRRVLEAGCGIGNFTDLLLDRDRLVCIDYDEFYVEMMRHRLGRLDNTRIEQLDLSSESDFKRIEDERFDSIISLNVLEHVEGDEDVLARLYRLLDPGGHAVILVPAGPWLFSECDRVLGHCRRYTRDELSEKMQRAGFEVVSLKPFNRFGVLGWWVNKLLKRGELSPAQLKLYDMILPIAKLFDLLRIGPGLSLVVVGRKPGGDGESDRASTGDSA